MLAKTSEEEITLQAGLSTPKFIKPGDLANYDNEPVNIICQFCSTGVTTHVSYDSGLLAYGIAVLLCMTGCWFGCCLLPFCVKYTKDVTHWCPNCESVVGVSRKC